jgi:hypothetical protein
MGKRRTARHADGTLVAERSAPRESFQDHEENTPWDPLHRAYFNGYALWSYLTLPFLFTVAAIGLSDIRYA